MVRLEVEMAAVWLTPYWVPDTLFILVISVPLVFALVGLFTGALGIWMCLYSESNLKAVDRAINEIEHEMGYAS